MEVKDQVVSDMSEIEAAYDEEFAEIPGFKDGQTIRIGSLSAGDFIEWQEANGKGEEAKRTAGLRLISKSLVGPAPKNERYALGEKSVAILRRKSHKHTENIVKEILKLNGIKVGDSKKDSVEAAKND